SFRSWPAQKALPAAAMTTTRTAASCATASSCACRASSIASDKALKACGRFMVRVTTPRGSRVFSTRASVGSDMATSSFDRGCGLRPLAQHELLDLAGGCLRNRLEAHLARHLVARQQAAAMGDQLIRRRGGARLQLDGGDRP